MIFAGQFIQVHLVGLADVGRNLVRSGTGSLVSLLEEVRGADGILHFVESLGMGVLFVDDLNDVEAVLGFDEVGGFAFVEAEGGLLEFRHGLTLNQPAQIATFGLGAGILGVFLGQILEVGALLFGLGEDVLGLGFDFDDFGVGLTHSH